MFDYDSQAIDRNMVVTWVVFGSPENDLRGVLRSSKVRIVLRVPWIVGEYAISYTRWFNVFFLSPSWRSLNLSKGHLTISKRSQRRYQVYRYMIYEWYEYHAMYVWISCCIYIYIHKYIYIHTICIRVIFLPPWVHLSLHMTHDKGWTCPFYCSCWFPIGNGKQPNTVGWYTHHEWMPFC